MKIRSLAFTGYPVTDIARARAFYEGVLGLKTAAVFEHEGKHWIEYDVGGATFAIANMNPTWRPSPDGPSAAFEVEDFDGSVAELRAAGVPFLMEPLDTGVCRLASVGDPDGNAVVIHQRYVAG